MTRLEADIQALSNSLIAEIFKGLGLAEDGWARRNFGRVFAEATERFANIGVQFDRLVVQSGFTQAAEWALTNFVRGVSAHGTEHIPCEGPLLVVSNHPGTCDALVIASYLRRDDLKIVVGNMPFLRSLPCAPKHFIFAPPPFDIHARMNTIRAAIRHLLEDGALLIFPSGNIDPDPAIWPEAEKHLEKWSPSVEMLLRKVPQTRVLISIVSGVLSAKWARNPITWLRKEALDRRRLAEFGQVVQQLFFPDRLFLSPRVSFAPATTITELSDKSRSERLLPEIITRAKRLLAEHMVS